MVFSHLDNYFKHERFYSVKTKKTTIEQAMKTNTRSFSSYDLTKAISRAVRFMDINHCELIEDTVEVLPQNKGYIVTVRYRMG
jgi:hypothetical protein